MISLSSHRGYSSCTDSGNVHINAHSTALFVGLLLSEKYIIQFNSDGNINTILFPIYFSFTTMKTYLNSIGIHTFGANTTNWVTVVPMMRQPDVTPYNITSCSVSNRDRVRPTALRMTTLYRHSPIWWESFNAAIVTCQGKTAYESSLCMCTHMYIPSNK